LVPADDIGEQVLRFRCDGDPVAAEALAWRACRLALRTAAAMLGSREEAADVAQDVAVDVLRSLERCAHSPGPIWPARQPLRHGDPAPPRNVTIAWIDSEGRVHGPGVFVPSTIGYGGRPIGPERPH
jgi:hypothetical protein